ncbi:MAG: hypothetical protein QOE25_1091 [Actinomycetota bacterium]|nr:hypothetical protein [Actinomycetota bacterium]
MRRGAVFACIALMWTGLAVGSARAECVAPSVSIKGSQGPAGGAVMRAGASVTIVGTGWFSNCNDTPGPCERAGVSGLQVGIEVGIVPARRTGGGWRPTGDVVLLGTRDADSTYGFTITRARMPATPGRYFLVAGIGGHPLQPYQQVQISG